MANEDIRKLIKEECLKHWKLAERLGISDITLSRRLRKELSTEEKEKIKREILRYREEKANEQLGL